MCHFSDESCGQTWTQYSLTFCWRSAHLSGRRRFWSCPWFQRRAELQTDARTETGYGLWHHMWTRQHHYWPTLCNMDCVQTDLSTFKVWDFQGRFCSSAVSMLVLKSYGLINSPALSFSSKFNRLNPSLKFQACRGRCLIKTNKPFCLSRLLWSWIFSSWTSKIFTVPFSQPAWETHTSNTHTPSEMLGGAVMLQTEKKRFEPTASMVPCRLQPMVHTGPPNVSTLDLGFRFSRSYSVISPFKPAAKSRWWSQHSVSAALLSLPGITCSRKTQLK